MTPQDPGSWILTAWEQGEATLGGCLVLPYSSIFMFLSKRTCCGDSPLLPSHRQQDPREFQRTLCLPPARLDRLDLQCSVKNERSSLLAPSNIFYRLVWKTEGGGGAKRWCIYPILWGNACRAHRSTQSARTGESARLGGPLIVVEQSFPLTRFSHFLDIFHRDWAHPKQIIIHVLVQHSAAHNLAAMGVFQPHRASEEREYRKALQIEARTLTIPSPNQTVQRGPPLSCHKNHVCLRNRSAPLRKKHRKQRKTKEWTFGRRSPLRR